MNRRYFISALSAIPFFGKYLFADTRKTFNISVKCKFLDNAHVMARVVAIAEAGYNKTLGLPEDNILKDLYVCLAMALDDYVETVEPIAKHVDHLLNSNSRIALNSPKLILTDKGKALNPEHDFNITFILEKDRCVSAFSKITE